MSTSFDPQKNYKDQQARSFIRRVGGWIRVDRTLRELCRRKKAEDVSPSDLMGLQFRQAGGKVCVSPNTQTILMSDTYGSVSLWSITGPWSGTTDTDTETDTDSDTDDWVMQRHPKKTWSVDLQSTFTAQTLDVRASVMASDEVKIDDRLFPPNANENNGSEGDSNSENVDGSDSEALHVMTAESSHAELQQSSNIICDVSWWADRVAVIAYVSGHVILARLSHASGFTSGKSARVTCTNLLGEAVWFHGIPRITNPALRPCAMLTHKEEKSTELQRCFILECERRFKRRRKVSDG